MASNVHASLHINVVGLEAMQKPFDKGAKGPSYRDLTGFERLTDSAYRAVRTKTHVDTGGLRRSGFPATHFDGEEWSGTISFARNPGIFELARGNTPSKAHPEGGHFFFEAVEPFLPLFENEVKNYFRRLFDENAPI